MWFQKRISEEDQVQKWLSSLQERFSLNVKEADELYALTRTCFAHNFGEADVKKVIYNYLSAIGRKLGSNDVESDSVFTYRAGSRRYGKWSWQESAFGLMAYLLTTLFFLIDIIVPAEEFTKVATDQFFAVILVLIVWKLLDKCSRARPRTIILFNAVNRFMPTLTMVAYLFFHLCKMNFFGMDSAWIWGMKVSVIAYVGIGILLTIYYLLQYKRATFLKDKA